MSDYKILFDKKTVKMTAFGRDIGVTNNVRNELNGLRAVNQVVYTSNADGGKGKPYYPRQFPVGDWIITDIKAKNPTDKYLFPFFIATNAHQPVRFRELVLNNDGSNYGNEAGITEDYAYGIHFSTSGTTLGCIKIVLQDDLLWLVGKIKDEWKLNRIVGFKVV